MHYYAPDGAAAIHAHRVALAGIATTQIAVDHFIHLTVIRASVLPGEVDALSLWSQYNPHGVFTALEALGNLLICAALACSAPAFPRPSRLERVVRGLRPRARCPRRVLRGVRTGS